MTRATSTALAALVLFAASPALATPRWGGFGQMHQGTLVGSFGMVSGLDGPEALGPDGEVGGFGLTFGGGGRALLFGRLLIGGKGFGILMPDTYTERGVASAGGGGGGLDVGWAFVNDGRYLMYPIIGVGGLGFDVDVANDSATDITIGDVVIAPGRRAHFSTGVLYAEIGAGMQQLLFDVGGGFILGGEVGLLVSVAGSKVEDAAERNVPGVDPASLLGWYTRLTIGGGGFSGTGE